jgi:hypothetical protein
MSGKGGNSRRRSRHREREHGRWSENPESQRGWEPSQPEGRGKKKGEKLKFDNSLGIIYERPKWTPVKPPSDPLPSPNCPICGKPIKDIAAAVNDKNSGEPAHFDCVMAKIAEFEPLEKGDTLSYIGGGRFGVVHFNGPQETRNFQIKKILEWEDKDNRAEWRRHIADYYSVT